MDVAVVVVHVIVGLGGTIFMVTFDFESIKCPNWILGYLCKASFMCSSSL